MGADYYETKENIRANKRKGYRTSELEKTQKSWALLLTKTFISEKTFI